MVVHSCTSNSFSGLENYVLDLVTWQYRHGKPVTLFCRENSPICEGAIARGVPVWTIGANDRPGPLLWAKMYGAWREKLKAGDVMLHMHAGGEPLFHWPWLAPPTRSRSLIKTVLHFHIWINHRKTDPFHRLVYAGVDEVWTSSETARAHLASLLPLNRQRIRVVPYGRDVRALREAPVAEWRREQRARLGLREEDVLAVCVSRIEPIKGVGELVDAFVRIARKYPNAHLAIVGGASPDNPEAERFAAKIKERHGRLEPEIRSRLHFLGFVSPCLPVLAAADFYVLPSYEECMSLAMLDAVIMGLPILGTNSGGTPSVARPDETGVLVPPANAQALADGLEVLYRDPEVIRRLGEGARALGPSFNQEDIFLQIWDWYGARPPTTIVT